MITYQALAAEAEARWRADPARLLKAVEIAAEGHSIYNLRCPEGEYDVRSQTALNGWYHVDTNAHTCTCQDSQRGHVCKHRLAVWLYTEQTKRSREQIVTRAKQMAAPTMAEIEQANAAWQAGIIERRQEDLTALGY